MACKNDTCLTVYFIVSVLLSATFLIIAFVVLPQIIYESVESNVQLLDNTIQFDRFMELPVPFHFKVNFFQIENPDEVLLGAVPKVTEIGPYVYTEIRTKNLSAKGSDILTFTEKWNFEFNADESKGLTENDEIYIINVALFAVLQSLEDLPFPLPISIEQLTSEIFEDNNIFTKVKVREYAFDGIKMCDPERNLNHWTMLVCALIMLMNQKVLKYESDGLILFSLFGYKENDDGPFTMKRGIKEIDKLGLVTSLKGQQYTEFWNRSSKTSCDHVNGHSALFPPFMKKDSSYKIYSTDICKTGNLNYAEATTYRDINVYRFQTDEKSFSSPEETCVCIKKTKDIDGHFNCLNEGILDLSTCFGGSPVVLSMPHLMFAAPRYQEAILGLNSNYTLDHNTFLEFEPHLGLPLRAEIRIQFNTVLRPIMYRGKVLPKTKDLSRALFPLLWVEDGFELTDELIEEINEKLVDPLALAEIVKWTLVGLSAFLMITSIGLIIFCKCKGKAYETA